MAKFNPFFDVEIPKGYSPQERQAIAAEVIDYVISRTESGLDANNKSFAKYSKDYVESKGQDNVDLTFSGDMLAEIQLLQQKSGFIRIGYDKGYEGIGKVEGNVLGTYGQDSPVKGKARNFLGITKKDLDSILANYPLRDKEVRSERVSLVKEAGVVAQDILDNTGFEAE